MAAALEARGNAERAVAILAEYVENAEAGEGATALAASVPKSRRMRCRPMSTPDALPAEVRIRPSST